MKRLIAGAALLAMVIAVYVLRIDDTAGVYKDDAYYMVLAKALATGQGYALINSASAPILPAFPPGFALLLAPVFAVAPNFPGNLIWLKAISIASMFGAGLLTYRYFRYRETGRGQAAVIGLLATLTPGFVFLATSTVMSECAFTLAMMGSAVALERAARLTDSRARGAIVLAGIVTTIAWLIRGSGIALVAGGAAFLLWKRGWRATAGLLVVCAICYSPWTAYDATHRASDAERVAYGGDAVRYYHSPLVSKTGEAPIEAGDLRRRFTNNLVNVFGRDIGAAIFPAGYRGADESGLEVFLLAGATGLRAGSMGIGPVFVTASMIVSLFVLAGALAMCRRRIGAAEFFCATTIGMVVLISSHSYRYVLPIAPFLIGYFLAGVEAIAARIRAGAGSSAFRIAAGCLLFFLLFEHGQYIWLKTYGPTPALIQDGRDVRAVTDFVGLHLPDGATAVSTNPGLIYLATGHKAVVYIDPINGWERWKAAGIRYAVALHGVPKPGSEFGYRVLYESPRLRLWVLEMVPSSP